MILSKLGSFCVNHSRVGARSLVASRLAIRCQRIRSTTTAVQQNTGISFPDKIVGGWLLACSGMAFGAVMLGGITRLTKSGLSMTDWHPLDERRPKTQEEWENEFNKYKQFPEYQKLNKDMTMDQFKSIYHMEYIHRMWGRSIGAVYYIPAAVFWGIGYIKPVMKKRVVIMGGLLAAQGLMGWYMVKSGLEEKTGRDTTPRVSNLRLASHLAAAFVFYSLLFRSALDHLAPAIQLESTSKLVRFVKLTHAGKGLVFLTALSGALVAGIEAGLVYNSFPKMADRWIPSDILAFEPKWSNFIENPTTVQFDHRMLGQSTFLFLSGLYLASRRLNLSPRARLASHAVIAAASLQVALGISTLLTYVPTPLAAAHQAGALTLLSTLLWLSHELKLAQTVPRVLKSMPK